MTTSGTYVGAMSDQKHFTDLEMARQRALRNGIYHTMRREFFERWERRLNFVVLLLGTATATQVATSHFGANGTMALGVATAFVGGLQLVYNLGGRARDHANLQGKFYDLAARTEERGGDEALRAQEIEKAFAILYGAEPPTYWGVNAIAYNGSQGAAGRDEKDNLVVPFYLKPFINVLTLSPGWFQTEREAEKKRSEKLGRQNHQPTPTT
jgi:hypothetical protein